MAASYLENTNDVRGIGPELVEAREDGVPWKVLMRKYDLSRAWLHRLWRHAMDEKMSSRHLEPGQERRVSLLNGR